MDRFIKEFAAVADRDLMLCQKDGCAYQADMSSPVPYDEAYFDKYVGYEGQDIALKLNAGRVAFVNSHVGADASVLDIGIGSGEFIKTRPRTFGHDVNPKAIEWLQSEGKWAASLWAFMAFSFWDVIEHVQDPDIYISQMVIGSNLFASVPIFSDLTRIRESKHYRPNEHFYYFTEAGFVDWIAKYGFRLKEVSDFETAAGREDILTFAFERTSK
jgi:hypothetical protein